jgi:hypothetical protein
VKPSASTLPLQGGNAGAMLKVPDSLLICQNDRRFRTTSSATTAATADATITGRLRRKEIDAMSATRRVQARWKR